MGALIHAKNVKGRKLWYVWGAVGDRKWEKHYPDVRSRREMRDRLRGELGLPGSASDYEVVFTLANKTWDGERWADDFSIQLRKLREEKGLTQAQLADKAGMSLQGVAALEQGYRSPTWETVLRLASALGVPETAFKIPVPVSDESA